jgi:alpha-galactosidase
MASINVQRMAVHAAIEGDLDLLKLAVLHDPLTGAICTPEEVWQMVDEMVVAQARWLPQYAHAIAGARERLAHATVKTRDWAGAAPKTKPPVWLAPGAGPDGGELRKGAA